MIAGFTDYFYLLYRCLPFFRNCQEFIKGKRYQIIFYLCYGIQYMLKSYLISYLPFHKSILCPYQ